MTLFCAAIGRDSVSLLRFLFLLVGYFAGSSLEISIQFFFFPSMVLNYFHYSGYSYAVSTVTGCCK